MPNDEAGTFDLLLPRRRAAAREKALRERIVGVVRRISTLRLSPRDAQLRAEGT